VDSFATKVHETEHKFEEMKKARDEWLTKATDAESKINELTNTMLRFLLSLPEVYINILLTVS
jgi:myosin V